MVEGARLESVYAGDRIEGSNPFLSAKISQKLHTTFLRNWLRNPVWAHSWHTWEEEVWLMLAKYYIVSKYEFQKLP